jgi:hypothetical protein
MKKEGSRQEEAEEGKNTERRARKKRIGAGRVGGLNGRLRSVERKHLAGWFPAPQTFTAQPLRQFTAPFP